MEAVDKDKGGMFFVYGYGGTGKTYLYKTMSAALRSQGEIVLNVASSGIADLLLEGGRTAHSRFAIPINVVKDSMCHIAADSELADLIRKSKLIIWDEALMINRHCYEAFDRTLKDICRSDRSTASKQVFGGKVVLFGGDFRQILPVIPNSSRQDVVHATINSSYLWEHCTVERTSVDSSYKDWFHNRFSYWLIPESDDQRAILAPTHEMVDIINKRMLSLIPREVKIYESSDSVSVADADDTNFNLDLYTTDFLNTIKVSGVPHHMLALKIGAPVMCMRNIDQKAGLCNGTRLQILRMGINIIEGKIISGGKVGEICAIPRMVITPTDNKMPFKLNRRQFPVQVCFAMTINKSQGQTLSQVGLFLQKPVFSHGQLYVAASRVKNKKRLKVIFCDEDGNYTNSTTNVVYKEVLFRL
ncbi:ATP-dependent DNA helicase PIF1-like protein [Tanacetum coccineum]